MHPHSPSWNYIAAMFSYEFQGGGVDYDTIETIHRGEIGEWVVSLAQSGLLERTTIEEVEVAWSQQPRLLLDMLLIDADQMTRRRCEMAWASLDRLAPIAQSG